MHRRTTSTALLAATGVLVVAGGASAAKPPSAGNDTLTIKADPSPVRSGDPVTISGKVSKPEAGETVRLQADPFPFADNGFSEVAMVATANGGGYSFVQRPLVNTRYRTIAKTSPPVTSPAITVLVAFRVTMRVSDRTPSRGERVRFSGTVQPRKDGSSAQIQRRRADGKFVTVKRTPLRVASESRSRYSTRVRITRTGTYRVRVGGTAANVAGSSPARTLTVG